MTLRCVERFSLEGIWGGLKNLGLDLELCFLLSFFWIDVCGGKLAGGKKKGTFCFCFYDVYMC